MKYIQFDYSFSKEDKPILHTDKNAKEAITGLHLSIYVKVL